MTSSAQIEANRRNAANSTGPRTPEGKAVVALNALKHGLLSRESLVKGENEADLIAFGKSLRTQLGPVGEIELLLADRIVSSAWRLRRIVATEAALYKADRTPAQVFGYGSRETMGVLSRYEVTLERGMYKALHELQRLQAARRGEAVPLPEAVDVDITVRESNEPDEMALIGKKTEIGGAEIETTANN